MAIQHRFKWCLLLILLLSSTVGCKWGHIGYNTGYKPEQPIPFSHKLHAGDYKVPCLYCHTQVEYAKASSVPPLNTCMNCHVLVATDKPAIQKLSEAYRNGETIEWVNVHMLPDHVKFNHKVHVHAFSKPEDRYVACQKCHGDVKQMDVVEQVNSLSMGWCIDCHRSSTPQGPLNCSTCHH